MKRKLDSQATEQINAVKVHKTEEMKSLEARRYSDQLNSLRSQSSTSASADSAAASASANSKLPPLKKGSFPRTLSIENIQRFEQSTELGLKRSNSKREGYSVLK
jgi:hypothetical protein